MKSKRLAIAIAVTAALGAGAASQAYAGAFAESEINISLFVLTKGGGTPLDITDFVPGTLNITDNLTNTAVLNGGTSFFTASATTFVPFVDAAQASVGANPHGANDFVPDTAPPTSTFARADNFLTGQPITGTGFPLGVSSPEIAETSLLGSATGNSDSNGIFTTTFNFQLAKPIGGADIEFDASTFLQAWTSAGSAPGTLAGSGFSWEITLVDGVTGTTLVDWAPGKTVTGLTVLSSPCVLVNSTSATNNQPTGPTTCSGAFSAVTSIPLLANHPYSFTINQNQTTHATSVPEPATLALLGIGLAGLGLARRRRAG